MFLTFPATNTQPKTILNLYKLLEIKEIVDAHAFKLEVCYLAGQEVSVRTYHYETEKDLNKAFLEVTGHLGANQLSGGKFINKAGQ